MEVHELDQEFAEVPLETFLGPIVYKIYLGSALMYVGMSGQGFSRALTTGHQHAEVLRHELARLEVMSCRTASEALGIENELIRFHKPPLNKTVEKSSRQNPWKQRDEYKKLQRDTRRKRTK